jgi:polar amino acid transport system substrate-binding protein
MKRRKNIKRLAALAGLLLCFCLLLLPTEALAEPEAKKIITVAGDAYFPPFEFLDERDGLKVYRGFNIDLIRAVIAKTDYELQFLPLAWEEALRALQDGRVDAVGGMKYDAERAHYFDFSEEYLISSLAIFVARDNSIIVELSDLENKRIAVQKDDIAYQKLKNRVLELTATVSQEEAIKLLLAEKVDAVVGNRMAGQYIVQRLGAMERVKSVGGFINPERYGFAVRRGNDELLAKFNEGLRKVKNDGTYDQIYVKWFGEPVDYPAYYYKKYLSYLGLGLLATLLLSLVFWRINVVLKREVANRTQELKQVNEKLVRMNRYIQDVNRYQSSVLNSGYGGILTSDAAGVIRFANQYACERLAIDGEATGKNLRDIAGCDWIAAVLQAGDAAGEVQLGADWMEYAVLRLAAENQQEEIVVHFRDISEEKKLREDVGKRHKMEALGQLVASIAHEIRTPLTSIKTFTEMLPNKYDNADFREKISRFVPQEIERLNRVVNDLLSYANPPTVQRERLPLKSLVDGVLVYFADAISRQGIRLSVDFDDKLPVWVDRHQMKQVLINVLLNAVQALEGRPEPRLRLSAEQREGTVHLLVTDNGPGISPSALHKAFEPFFTTKTGGTGLGLFVSYQLARRNGVEIQLESPPTGGMAVRLIFGPNPEVLS